VGHLAKRCAMHGCRCCRCLAACHAPSAGAHFQGCTRTRIKDQARLTASADSAGRRGGVSMLQLQLL
jgi:hypothetical protein